MPQIEVTFDIDANGILNVSARDKATGKEQKVRIEATGGLSESEIKRMVADAEQHSDEDKKRREAIEVKNRGEQLVYETEKNIREMGEKIDSESKARLDSAVERLKGAVQRNDTDEIRSASEALSQIWNEVSSKLYQQASAGGGQGGPGPGAPGDGASQAPPQGGEGEGKKRGPDDEIEADYEVVK